MGIGVVGALSTMGRGVLIDEGENDDRRDDVITRGAGEGVLTRRHWRCDRVQNIRSVSINFFPFASLSL